MNLLRSLLFYFGYFLAIFVSGVLFLPVAPFLALPSRYRLLNLYNHFITAWFRWTCGVTYRVRGRENLPAGACVILANHQCEWETLYLQVLKPPVCTVLKQELLRIPIFGWGLRLLHPIGLDRSKPARAMRQVLGQGVARLQEGLSVLIFPEGTRVDPGHRRRYNKSGAVIACRAGVPVLPVAHNAGERWPGRHWIKNPPSSAGSRWPPARRRRPASARSGLGGADRRCLVAEHFANRASSVTSPTGVEVPWVLR
jgi:1-acyl-sn-glycerol-3-phosphate acyltransferase